MQYPEEKGRHAVRSRDTLHQLGDRIPEDELRAAQRFLEFLASNPAFRATANAAPDDEPRTAGDAAAIAQGREEIRAGKVVPHEGILKEFGLR